MSQKRCSNNHSIRLGKKGDKPTGMERMVGDGDIIPSYVLICNDEQVGAMDGPLNFLIFLKIFEDFQGIKHSEIFLELIEEMAREKKLNRIETSSASDPKMERALKRCGYFLGKNGCYYKDL